MNQSYEGVCSNITGITRRGGEDVEYPEKALHNT